jgi:hypothetical protein
MNISNVVGTLFPIFFVLALGYLAGKHQGVVDSFKTRCERL